MKKPAESRSTALKKLQALLVQKDSLLEEKDSEIKKLQEKNQYLLEQFRLAQQKQFGKSSEAHPGQGELFNEAEQIIDEVVEPAKESAPRTRQQPKRQALPEDLPREVRVVDISDEEKSCDCCGHDLHKMARRQANS